MMAEHTSLRLHGGRFSSALYRSLISGILSSRMACVAGHDTKRCWISSSSSSHIGHLGSSPLCFFQLDAWMFIRPTRMRALVLAASVRKGLSLHTLHTPWACSIQLFQTMSFDASRFSGFHCSSVTEV